MSRRFGFWAGILVIEAISTPSVAGAEGIATKVLEELTSSLEDLAKTELANGLGRVIAERSRPLCFYFRGTIDRLETNQWGNLNHALQEGLTELLGDLIVATVTSDGHATTPGAGVDSHGVETQLQRFLKRGPFGEKSGLRGKPASYFCEGREKLERCCSLRRWNEIGAQTLFEQVCKASKDREHQAECLLARTMVAAVGGEPLAREYAFGLLGYVSARPMMSRLKEIGKLPQTIVELWKRSMDLRANVRRWIEDLKGIDAATADIDAHFATLRRAGETGSRSRQATEADRAVIRDACVHFVGRLADIGLPGVAAIDRAGGSGGEVMSGSACGSGVPSPEFMARGLAIRDEVLRMRSYLAAAHSAEWAQGQNRIDVQGLVVAASAICREEEIAMAAVASAGAVGAENTAIPICRAVRHLRESLDGFAFRRVIADAAKGDYRALARAILPTALRRSKDPKAGRETNADRLAHLYSEFLQNFASFVLDGGDGHATQAIAAEAFRRSARELLMNLSGSATGYPQGGLTTWSWPRGVSAGRAIANTFIPSFSFRLSWNAHYFNQSGGDGFRFSPSLDFFSFRAALSENLGLQLSLLDPLAPLVEIAMRKSRTVENEEHLALDAVRPRLDFWFGIPQVTRRFALVAGVSLRFVRAALATRVDANQVAVESLRYSAGGSLEFNVGAMAFF
ncbi:MAG: hypothetical protein HYY84_08080 [Deltaproteobacteria bacterium]|nr:hypothetical protein [Deltaproteobacteria bacterium]